MTERPRPTEQQIRTSRKLFSVIIVISAVSIVCGVLALVSRAFVPGYTMLILGVLVGLLAAFGVAAANKQLRP